MLFCTVLSTCFLICVDDAIFGTDTRFLAHYSERPAPDVWNDVVIHQLTSDIFVPLFWGSIITVVEVIILYHLHLLRRNASSAILVAALWLLPLTLAIIRLVSFYGYTFPVLTPAHP